MKVKSSFMLVLVMHSVTAYNLVTVFNLANWLITTDRFFFPIVCRCFNGWAKYSRRECLLTVWSRFLLINVFGSSVHRSLLCHNWLIGIFLIVDETKCPVCQGTVIAEGWYKEATVFISSIFHARGLWYRWHVAFSDMLVSTLVVILDSRFRDPHSSYPAGLVGTTMGGKRRVFSLLKRKNYSFSLRPYAY